MVESEILGKEVRQIPVETEQLSIGLSVFPNLETPTNRLLNPCGFDHNKTLYGIYKRIGIPIVFDYHHHKFCTGDLSEQEALELAISTWPKGIKPIVHYSESRSEEYSDPKIKDNAHSDYIYNHIDDYGLDIDIMIEAKAKELALLRYRELWESPDE